MSDGQYILPSELLLLAVFVFAPAVALGLGVQALALAKMGLLASRRRQHKDAQHAMASLAAGAQCGLTTRSTPDPLRQAP